VYMYIAAPFCVMCMEEEKFGCLIAVLFVFSVWCCYCYYEALLLYVHVARVVYLLSN